MEINPSKIQGLTQKVKFLDIYWFRGFMSLSHIDTYSKTDPLERWYNSLTDEQC